MNDISQQEQTHTLALIAENEPGVLARVIGLFSGRGYNIDSITAAEIDAKKKISRITIMCTGTPMVIGQIKNQLARLIPVHQVRDLTQEGAFVDRQLALLKINGVGDKRIEALRIADIFRARVVDSTLESFVFEITGDQGKIKAFTDLMEPLGLVEIVRTGVVALCRGENAINIDNVQALAS